MLSNTALGGCREFWYQRTSGFPPWITLKQGEGKVKANTFALTAIVMG